MATFVLVHGGWTGGWAWRAVAHTLRAAGHDVFTPTLTGSGERVHLASPDVGLPTHILDIVNVLYYEDLHDVVLVANSAGGMVITGVAEQVPERLSQLVYLDAFAPLDGQSLTDVLGPQLSGVFAARADAMGDGWRVPHLPPDADRHTDFLLKVAQHPLVVRNPLAAQLPHTFVLHTAKPADDPLAPILAATAARAQAAGWHYRELATDHWPLVDQPADVAALLDALVAQTGADEAA